MIFVVVMVVVVVFIVVIVGICKNKEVKERFGGFSKC